MMEKTIAKYCTTDRSMATFTGPQALMLRLRAAS